MIIARSSGVPGAPVDATFITQTPSAILSNEQALSALASGILYSTTGTGVVSIATEGVDYYGPGGTDVAVTDGGTGASTAQAAINTLTAVAGATNEHVLTKDTGTGNAIFKAASGAGLPVDDDTAIVYETGVPANTLTFDVTPFTAARVWTFPDATTTVAGLGVAQTFTAAQTLNSTLTMTNGIFSQSLTSTSPGTSTNSNVHGFTINAGGTSISQIQRGVYYVITTTGTAGGTSSVIGTEGVVTHFNTGLLASMFGHSAELKNTNTGSVTIAQVYRARSTLTNTGGFTNLYHFVALPPTISSTGGIGTSYGFYCGNMGSTSHVTNAYGLYIESMQNATSKNYAIYTNAGDISLNSGNGQCDFVLKGANYNLIETDSSDDELFLGGNAATVIGFYGSAGTAQPAAVADATGAGDIVAQFNTLLARLRANGSIAT